MKAMNRRLAYAINILIVVVMAATSVQFSSCTSRRSKEKAEDLIPASHLVPLLTDLYLADGLIFLSEVGAKHRMKDSVTIYIEVVENFGYTKAQVDRTLRYYFINKPKKLQRIFDQVVARMSEMESTVSLELPKPVIFEENLWPGKIAYAFPEDGLNDPVYFDCPIADTGLYNLKTTILIYPDDQSEDPRITVWFWKADTSAAGVTIYWDEVALPKDGLAHEYLLSAVVPDSSFTNIRGWLLNHNGKPGHWEKHSSINLISLTRVDRSIVE
jgi:hypothetical protein